jgi:hypothetical protein
VLNASPTLPALAQAAEEWKSRAAARAQAQKIGGGVTAPLAVNRACPVARQPGTAADTRPFGTERDPCPRCGTRGDYGCAHLRPSGEKK